MSDLLGKTEIDTRGASIKLRVTSMIDEAQAIAHRGLKRFAFNLIHKIECETPTPLRGRGPFAIFPESGKMQKALVTSIEPLASFAWRLSER